MKGDYYEDDRIHSNSKNDNGNDNNQHSFAGGTQRARKMNQQYHHQDRKRKIDQDYSNETKTLGDEQRVLVLEQIPPETTWRDIFNHTDKAQFVHVDRDTRKAFVKMASHRVATELLEGNSWKYQSHLVGLHPSNLIDTDNNQLHKNGEHNDTNHSNLQSSTVVKHQIEKNSYVNDSLPSDSKLNDEKNMNDVNKDQAKATPTKQLLRNNDQYASTSKTPGANSTAGHSNSTNKKYFARSAMSPLGVWEQKKELLEKKECMYQKQLALHKQIYEKQSSKTTSKLKEILTLQTKINSLKKEYLQHLQQKPKQTPILYSLDKRTTTLQSPYTSEEELASFLKTNFPQYSPSKHYTILLKTAQVEENSNNNNNNNNINVIICVKLLTRIIAERIKAQTDWDWCNLPNPMDDTSKDVGHQADKQIERSNSEKDAGEGEGAIVSVTILDEDHGKNVDEEEGNDILVDYDDYDDE